VFLNTMIPRDGWSLVYEQAATSEPGTFVTIPGVTPLNPVPSTPTTMVGAAWTALVLSGLLPSVCNDGDLFEVSYAGSMVVSTASCSLGIGSKNSSEFSGAVTLIPGSTQLLNFGGSVNVNILSRHLVAANGSAATLTLGAFPGVTVTGLSGIGSNIVGAQITISGAANAANNGSYYVSAYISATSVTIVNPNAVAGDANNGSLKWSVQNSLWDFNLMGADYINGGAASILNPKGAYTFLVRQYRRNNMLAQFPYYNDKVNA
jgi:hypothetical protein